MMVMFCVLGNRSNCQNAGRIWASTPQIADDTEDADLRGRSSLAPAEQHVYS